MNHSYGPRCLRSRTKFLPSCDGQLEDFGDSFRLEATALNHMVAIILDGTNHQVPGCHFATKPLVSNPLDIVVELVKRIEPKKVGGAALNSSPNLSVP